MQRLCVYCGSRPGEAPAYVEGAESLGRLLAERDVDLVYGGGSVGVMGALADATLSAGGDVYGVIPEPLIRREGTHGGLTEQFVVDSMHERKRLMVDLAEGFLALPGGLGTLEELFEVLTWAQLGIHDHPCGLLDVAGYYGGLVDFLDAAVAEGFVEPADRDLLLVGGDPDDLLDRMAAFDPPEREAWLTDEET